MAEDYGKLNGQVAQAFVPGGSNAAALTHDLTNVQYWCSDVDVVFSYNTGDFDAAVNLPAFMVLGVPSDATTVTFTVSSKIFYSRKSQSGG